jgi:ABC-type transport system involved in multi-copper enzyme maturation permease subunit
VNPRAVLLIARTVLLEAVRRREVYVLALGALLLVGAVLQVDFFALRGLNKFYRETALRIMDVSVGLLVILLAVRQLPREFAQRTLYPLLARPVSRLDFLAGKLVGVLGAAAFCFVLFVTVFVAATLYLEGAVPWALLAQHLLLQMLLMLVLACLGFLFSMLFTFDAALTLGVVFFAASSFMLHLATHLHATSGALGRAIAHGLTWGLPQLTLLDLSEKVVHADAWEPLSAPLLLGLTAYAGLYAGLYFLGALLLFRRKPL